MDLENIHKIMTSNLWKKITRHSYYRGHYILHTEPKNLSHYCALWVFFEWKITDRKIKEYWKEGACMFRNEFLDRRDLPIECYGKVLVYS